MLTVLNGNKKSYSERIWGHMFSSNAGSLLACITTDVWVVKARTTSEQMNFVATSPADGDTSTQKFLIIVKTRRILLIFWTLPVPGMLAKEVPVGPGPPGVTPPCTSATPVEGVESDVELGEVRLLSSRWLFARSGEGDCPEKSLRCTCFIYWLSTTRSACKIAVGQLILPRLSLFSGAPHWYSFISAC